ncbi:hypothetical protein KR032_007867, partial [Drosophila birchii]
TNKPRMIREGFLLVLVHLFFDSSMGIQYEFLLEDERIFSECADKPKGIGNLNNLFDLSNMNFTMDYGGISISGNLTLIWDVQPSDRIEMAGSLRYFDRGTWQPTTLNLLSKDFCKVMYDHRQIWYDLFVKYVANKPEIEDKCIKVKGVRVVYIYVCIYVFVLLTFKSLQTTFVVESYKLDPHIGLGVPLKPGRYAVHIEISAFDKSNVKRNSICSEMKGEFFKV